MNLTEKQTILVDACRERGQLTQIEAEELLKGSFLINHSKRVADILVRMARAGILEKVKPATYRLKEEAPHKDEDQLKLL